MIIAKELGYTLLELREKMTTEELLLWHGFFELQKQEEEKIMRKSRLQR